MASIKSSALWPSVRIDERKCRRLRASISRTSETSSRRASTRCSANAMSARAPVCNQHDIDYGDRYRGFDPPTSQPPRSGAAAAHAGARPSSRARATFDARHAAQPKGCTARAQPGVRRPRPRRPRAGVKVARQDAQKASAFPTRARAESSRALARGCDGERTATR